MEYPGGGEARRLAPLFSHLLEALLAQEAAPFCIRDLDFWRDWDWRQEKLTGVPRWALGSGHPIPVFGLLPKPKKREESL